MDEDTKTVMFVDLLGFADLTERFPNAVIEKPMIGPNNEEYTSPGVSPLVEVFYEFHRHVSEAAELVASRPGASAMLFSDCAFLSSPLTTHILDVARSLMRTLMERSVPVRMGIAIGDFHPVRFSTNTRHIWGGTASVYAAEFYGTGVVRAYRAERSGKGMRIFLSPSLEPHLDDSVKQSHIPLEPPSTHARWEADYLYPDEGDVPEPGGQWTLNIMTGLAHMQSTAPPDNGVQIHYVETLAAINRMRKARGLGPATLGHVPPALS